MLVTIATFSFLHEAQLAKAQLEAFGISAFVADEHTTRNLRWMYSNIAGWVRLQVPEEFAEQAQKILQEYELASVSEAEAEPEAGPEPEVEGK